MNQEPVNPTSPAKPILTSTSSSWARSSTLLEAAISRDTRGNLQDAPRIFDGQRLGQNKGRTTCEYIIDFQRVGCDADSDQLVAILRALTHGGKQCDRVWAMVTIDDQRVNLAVRPNKGEVSE